MPLVLGLLLLLATLASSFAGYPFRFYVFDETKTGQLHYEHVQDFTILDFPPQSPRLSYSTEYRLYGVNQKSFTFTSEDSVCDITPQACAELLETLRRLPTKGLDPKSDGPEQTSGNIDLDDKTYPVSARPNQSIRHQWQAALNSFLAAHLPAAERKKTTHTEPGDSTAALAVDFAALLQDPHRYDGQRVRLTGYYHGEFEGSSFAPSKAQIDDYRHAVWLGTPSTFADPADIKLPNDSTLTIEGTFHFGPGGHMSLWMGQLDRPTKVSPIR